MKKQILVLVSILVGAATFAQSGYPRIKPPPPIDSVTGKIKYTGDIDVLSVDFIPSKEELYSRALLWFKYDFHPGSKCAVQFQDKEAGIIIAKALIDYAYGPGNGDPYSLRERLDRQHDYIEYTISIQVMDGGYNYSMTDFNHLIEKVGSQIVDHGFPVKPLNQPTLGIDSVKLKIGNYNFTWEMITSTAEDRIASITKAMADETTIGIKWE